MNVQDPEIAAQLYLDLLKKSLTRYILSDTLPYRPMVRPFFRVHPLAWAAYPMVDRLTTALGLKLFRHAPFVAEKRADGSDGCPPEADTMIGLKRLDNLQYCITEVLRKNIPGDLIEAGVWRGGATIFMRAVLKAYGDRTRSVWVADSFAGLPRPDGRYQQDAGDPHWTFQNVLGVPLEEVKANFARYGLLDEQVHFLAGWFKDTLPTAAISQLAVLRCDGDMYSSTMDALQNLYPRLSPGGYAIVDDYGAVPACKQAVDDFRAHGKITERLERIDWTGVFWEKGAQR
jgi:O-methyltransferase